MASSTRGAATVPETLKPGIVNSNPDPNACIVCSTDLKRHSDSYKKSQTIFGCCGSDFCPSCVMLYQGKDCPVCGADPNDTQDDINRKVKRHAKKGHPWAQFLIGNGFDRGEHMMQSHYEAVRWFRKASAQGHPLATLNLGVHYVDGTGGCTRDLVAAIKYTEQGLAADPVAMKGDYEETMLDIAKEFTKEGNTEEAKRILKSLHDAGCTLAHWGLADLYIDEENWASAENALTACAMKGHVLAAWNVALITWDKSNMVAKASVWLKHTKANLHLLPSFSSRRARLETFVSVRHDRLCKLRGFCTTCDMPLDRSTRKLCSGCRTFCYCSTHCQKLHWGRGDGGHRDDCKAAHALLKVLKDIPVVDSVHQIISH